MPVIEQEGTRQGPRNERRELRKMERMRVPIPVFVSDNVGFDVYMKEVRAWR